MDRRDMYPELEQEFIDIIKMDLNYQPLDSRQAGMLFYWTRHKSENMFRNINIAVGLNADGSEKKKRKRIYKRRPKHEN